MLLVDNDDADARQRREHRRSRADDDIHITTTDAVPLIVAFTVRETAVLNSDAIAERAAKERGH